MNKAKVYIAAPVALSWGTVSKFRNKLSSAHIDVKLWERDGRYEDSWLNNADAVIFLLPDLSWGTKYNDLPIGLKRELSRAYAMNKKIFIGYETQMKDLNFYETDVRLGTSNDRISGIAGTTDSLKKYLKSINTIVELYENTFGKSRTVNDADFTKLWYDEMPKVNQSNPCLEIELPIAQKVFAKTIPNPDYTDRRLLLMM